MAISNKKLLTLFESILRSVDNENKSVAPTKYLVDDDISLADDSDSDDDAVSVAQTEEEDKDNSAHGEWIESLAHMTPTKLSREIREVLLFYKTPSEQTEIFIEKLKYYRPILEIDQLCMGLHLRYIPFESIQNGKPQLKLGGRVQNIVVHKGSVMVHLMAFFGGGGVGKRRSRVAIYKVPFDRAIFFHKCSNDEISILEINQYCLGDDASDDRCEFEEKN